MSRKVKALAAAALVLAAASPASAIGCYERTYAPAHLQNNPAQSVAAIILTSDTGEAPAQLEPGEFEMRLVVQDRRTRLWHARNAVCAAREGRIACGLESDGGAFTLVQARGESVMLRTDGELRVGDEDALMEFGGRRSDDNAFIMHPAACRRAG